ncbi:hypothetical protein LWM68_39570 [Niabella sp. W65]|nr:hypothetical protein [Niabella sp. W65]MCH7368299.1 hypothetical protein [Niabella sp. W65]ULT46169.1 hypothetical protein KRR40_11230 [Niabella sp. I65]
MNVDNIQLNFAFIKATEGVSLTDKQFKYNWRQSKSMRYPAEPTIFFYPARILFNRLNTLFRA